MLTNIFSANVYKNMKFFLDKFEQFWAINKKFMEHNSDELFRYIPFRIYVVS